jgi:hypothetical protein
MNHFKKLSILLAASAMCAFAGSGTASATTLEVGGVAKNSSVTFEISLEAGTSLTYRFTDSNLLTTCTVSSIKGKTEGSFSGSSVGGNISSLTYGSCTHTTKVVKNGSLTIESVGGTSGTVRSTGMEIQIQSTTFGLTINCSTNNTHFGTVSGRASGSATWKQTSVLACTPLSPSVHAESFYGFTSPLGFGVVA